MANTVTLLDFPQVTTVEDADLIYLVRGTGTDRDKVLPGSVLKAYLGETLLAVTETESVNLSNYKTNVLIVTDPTADIALTITGTLPGGNKCMIVNKSAYNVNLSIISTAPVVPSGEYIEYYSDGSAMNLLTGSYVMKQWMLETWYPVGIEVAQFPAAASSTEATAFPVANRPATRFGGTWTEIFNTDDAFFKVGTTDHQTRVDGLSPDQLQGHWHIGSSGLLYNVYSGSAVFGASSALGEVVSGGSLRGSLMGDPFSDGTHGSPRKGYVTEPRNRLMKIWKRTA